MSEMSPKEMNEIMGNTISRLREARKELACLESKARDISENIGTVGRALRGEIECICTGAAFVIQLPSRPKEVKWPTMQDVNDILLRRENLTNEIEQLRQQLRQMGISPDDL